MSTKLIAQRLSSATICGLLILASGCSQKSASEKTVPVEEAPVPETTMSTELTEPQKVHLTLGYSIGSDLMLDTYSTDEVEQILSGLRLASTGEKPEYVDSLRDQAFGILNEKRTRQARERTNNTLAENKAAGEAFLASIDGNEGIIKTDSGLRYEILKEGSEKFATAADRVNVHYHGTLVDGTVFDSSVDRGEPITFPLNGVVKGFSEGLTVVGEGGKIRLYMPSHLAYGDRDSGGPIGPGSTLIFEVELLKINP
jgi:FKBP-type peptidyl-prolyl cis-trans isomerase